MMVSAEFYLVSRRLRSNLERPLWCLWLNINLRIQCVSLQAAHEAMLEYGSTDLQALVQITGEGGAWSNPALITLLTKQPTDVDECQQLSISLSYTYSCSV